MNPPIEREIKLALDREVHLPDLTFLGYQVEDLGVIEFVGHYWDTRALDLMRAQLGLRRRVGLGWTFKGRSSMEGLAVVRTERNWPDAEQVPTEIEELVKDAVEERSLEVVASIQTRRRRMKLLAEGSRPLLEIDDDLVTVLDGGTPVGAFREVEIELLDEEAAQLAARVADELIRSGASAHTTPKYLRALQLLGKIA